MRKDVATGDVEDLEGAAAGGLPLQQLQHRPAENPELALEPVAQLALPR